MRKYMVLVVVVLAMVFGGCATNRQKTIHPVWTTAKPAPIRVQANQSVLVHRFRVTTLNATELKGVPFYARCQYPDRDQGFILGCRHGNETLPCVAVGYLDEDGIVWTNWLIEPLTTKPKEMLTFELWTIGADRVGILEVSLLGDFMFAADGSDPKNPPE